MTGETVGAAVKVLNDGGVVVYPTETCYGLGVDAMKSAAVKRVFDLKKRPLDLPLSVIVDSVDMIKQYAFISRDVERLINEYMPGPVTFIVKNKLFPPILCGGGNTVGFRIPDHVIALELVKEFGRPVTATSANIHGMPDPYEAPKLDVDFTINFGKLPIRPPSTVYDTIIKKTVRQGAVKL